MVSGCAGRRVLNHVAIGNLRVVRTFLQPAQKQVLLYGSAFLSPLFFSFVFLLFYLSVVTKRLYKTLV